MSSNGTRDRILDAAWRLCRERPVHEVTLAQVAQAAGVSRQALYLHFRDRAGLLTAMARHYDKTSGFLGRVTESLRMPPADGLAFVVRAWIEYCQEIEPVARALGASALLGDEAGAAWADRMTGLRAAFRHHVDRLAAEGRLAAGWTPEEAADWIYASTHFAKWQVLVRERGWSVARVADAMAGTVARDLVSPPANPDPSGRL